MGADSGGQADEQPAHSVTLRPFLLDRTEVTNSAYQECVHAGACKPNAASIASLTGAGDDARFHRPAQPVNGVSWFDARDYCAWRGARLPSEAEFERAVRDDDGRRFPWGNDPPTHDRTVFGQPLLTGSTENVGSHPGGRGPYGQDDLAGNVWEWIEDEYDPYAYSRPTAAEGKPGSCPEILAAQDELRREGKRGSSPGRTRFPRRASTCSVAGRSTTTPTGLRST